MSDGAKSPLELVEIPLRLSRCDVETVLGVIDGVTNILDTCCVSPVEVALKRTFAQFIAGCAAAGVAGPVPRPQMAKMTLARARARRAD